MDKKPCSIILDETDYDRGYQDGKADAIEELLKSICIGCAYLNGTKCENKLGCPCIISRAEVIRKANKVLNS